jgi:hypothetical protein
LPSRIAMACLRRSTEDLSDPVEEIESLVRPRCRARYGEGFGVGGGVLSSRITRNALLPSKSRRRVVLLHMQERCRSICACPSHHHPGVVIDVTRNRRSDMAASDGSRYALVSVTYNPISGDGD